MINNDNKLAPTNLDIQYLLLQLFKNINSYLSNTERKKEALCYIISLWYLASEEKLDNASIKKEEYYSSTTLPCMDAILYFKTLRNRFIYDNEEVTDRLLEDERHIIHLLNSLYQTAGKAYYQDFCLLLLHNEKLFNDIFKNDRMCNNDRLVLLQFILNWMKPNGSIFNPMLGFHAFPSFLPENCTFVGGSSDKINFHLFQLLWAHSEAAHALYPEEYPEVKNFQFLIWCEDFSSNFKNDVLSYQAITARKRTDYKKVFVDLLDLLKNKGKAACIISNGFWYYNVYKETKEQLFKSGYVDRVVILSSNKSLLLIDKARKWSSMVRLVDMHDIQIKLPDLQKYIRYSSRIYTFDTDKLKEKDYRLDLAEEFRKKYRPSATKGMRLVRLKEILTYHPLDYTAPNLVSPHWTRYNPLKNPYINNPTREKGEDMLVANLSNKHEFQPCLYRVSAKEQPHYELGETFDINNLLVDSCYLANELHKDYFIRQIFPLSSFNYFDSPLDAVNMFLSLNILVPDIETTLARQKILYDEEKRKRIRNEVLSYGYDPDLLSQSKATFLPEGCWLKEHTYQIKSSLSSGGFGKTYRATWYLQDSRKTIKTKVAVKEFFLKNIQKRDENTLDVITPLDHTEEISKALRKFMGEANRIKEFTDSPHIVNVYDAFDEHKTCYYVMEYIEGCTLEEYVERTESCTLDEKEALKIISQIASALDIMHQNHMNHLDVKPSNIMIDEDNDNRAVLIDFGTAHLFHEDEKSETSLLLVRSNGYTPPEIQSLHDFSPAFDIYSLGAILYFMLVGDAPSTTFKFEDEKCPDEVSETTWNAIGKAISFNREERPQSISAFMKLLNL